MAALVLLFAVVSPAWDADAPAPDPVQTGVAQSQPEQDELQEIIVRAVEPRFVAPTRRDRIGRIWAPVLINGQGPFRLVLDSGANRTGIIQSVATTLSLPQNERLVLLRGVTGNARVPTVRASSLEVGDLLLGSSDLPILPDAMGGADGILGTDRLLNRRIYIDFRNDLITIARSHQEPAPSGFLAVPFEMIRGNLLMVNAWVGGIKVVAIIDTGGQVTVANRSLLGALERRRKKIVTQPDRIIGVTAEEQDADVGATPAIRIDSQTPGQALIIRSEAMTFGDMRIFEHWNLVSIPAVLIGMDALGTLDTLIIDYKRREIQMKMKAE